jgi:hypothetical protein
MTQRDGVGRLLQATTQVGTSTVLTEDWSLSGDGLPTAYTAARSDFTDARSFGYGALHRRLTNEVLALGASQSATNGYTFDNGAEGRVGVARIGAETNSVLHRTATGTVNGPARLRGDVNGRPVDLRYNPSAAGQWSAELELTPGTNTLTVYADHPSSQFTTNKVSTFTVDGGARDRVDSQFDGGGYVTNRVWKNSQGRLVKVRERDTNTNGFNWQVDIDPLGRRLRTTTVPVTNGVALTAQARTLVHFYDPSVEFLEIGVAINGVVTWKNYGPDPDGRYAIWSRSRTGSRAPSRRRRASAWARISSSAARTMCWTWIGRSARSPNKPRTRHGHNSARAGAETTSWSLACSRRTRKLTNLKREPMWRCCRTAAVAARGPQCVIITASSRSASFRICRAN